MSLDFDYALWSARFPEFSSVSPVLAGAYFKESGLYLTGNGCVIKDEIAEQLILNLITAHIASLNATLPNGQPASALVGRISSATEGSVSVTTAMSLTSQSAEWWAQTKYGMQAWQALAPYRTALYYPGRPRQMNPFGYQTGHYPYG